MEIKLNSQALDSEYKGLEKRRFLRFSVNFPIKINDPWNKDELLVLEVGCRDISAQGVGIVSPQLLQPGAFLELRLQEAGGKEPLKVYGRIVWVNQIEKGIWRVGICFAQLQFKPIAYFRIEKR
jgi:hypothetical protein